MDRAVPGAGRAGAVAIRTEERAPVFRVDAVLRGARRGKLMLPFRYSPTLGLRVAAMVLPLAWLSLAGWLDGWRLVGILGWGWLWWWIAWRTVHTNGATLTSPESWLWM